MQIFEIALILSFLFQNVRLTVGKYQTTKEFFRVDKNKEIRSMDLEVIGSMSKSQCAAFCVENSDICCEITYVTLSGECKLGSSGCCHKEFNNVSDSNILHPGRKFSDYIYTLSVTNGGVFGDWTYQEFCTKGHYAVGYKMRIEGPDDDRTELNAIEIICGSRGVFLVVTQQVLVSEDGEVGERKYFVQLKHCWSHSLYKCISTISSKVLAVLALHNI
ncbi:unnamed protein product [Mytilus coruscus]|uniref:Apple domain-containing protein n=1 Tax=Mytilus coruscus TaxID=42192 RepID=A0A6J8DB97_MYTCO|nr:unnamed protein product [Mytilus coruscus]